MSSRRRNPPLVASNVYDVGCTRASEADRIDHLARQCQLNQSHFRRQLYDACYPKVFRLAARITGLDAADDVTQQVFLAAFRCINQFTGASRFETWLYRLTVNEALQVLRRERRHRLQSLPDEQPDRSLAANDTTENCELLEKAFQRVDPKLRTIFLMREVDRLSYDEIASILQIDVGTVGSRLNRARADLRKVIVTLGWEA